MKSASVILLVPVACCVVVVFGCSQQQPPTPVVEQKSPAVPPVAAKPVPPEVKAPDVPAADPNRATADSRAAEEQARTVLNQLDAKIEEDLSFPGKPITSIDIKNPVSDEGLAFICAGVPRLETLTLAKASVTKTGLERVAQLPRLKELNLTEFKSAEADLAPLAKCATLKTLSVRFSSQTVTGDTLKRMKNLESLEVPNVQINDQVLQQLAELGDLRQLSVSHCTGVTDSGTAVLKGLAKLEKLVLYNSPGLTDKCLDELKALKTLKALHLDYSKVTAAGAEDFKAAVPGCRIVFGVNQSR